MNNRVTLELVLLQSVGSTASSGTVAAVEEGPVAVEEVMVDVQAAGMLLLPVVKKEPVTVHARAARTFSTLENILG